VTLSDAKVGGFVTVWQGNLVMSDSQVVGKVAVTGAPPGGNIVLCPNPGNVSCTGLTAGYSTIGTAANSNTLAISNAEAWNTVTLATKTESSTCPGPVSNPPAPHGDEVTGCVYARYTKFSVEPPKAVSLPTVIAPSTRGSTAQDIAFALWTKAGYSIESTSTCGSGSNSVISDMSGATVPTVIVANCPVQFPAGGANSVTLSHNVALFATRGITFNSGFSFGASGSAVHLYFMVPTPSSGVCSTDNITFGTRSQSDFPGGGATLNTFFYTPCTFSVGPNDSPLAIKGEIVTGSLTIATTSTLTLKHELFKTLPDFSYGYQPLAVTRYIASG
jgi:hypothetical protein